MLLRDDMPDMLCLELVNPPAFKLSRGRRSADPGARIAEARPMLPMLARTSERRGVLAGVFAGVFPGIKGPSG